MKLNREEIAQILDLRTQRRGKKDATIGDIHGRYDDLNELLDEVDWFLTTVTF